MKNMCATKNTLDAFVADVSYVKVGSNAKS